MVIFKWGTCCEDSGVGSIFKFIYSSTRVLRGLSRTVL